jgi:hypothetical protein
MMRVVEQSNPKKNVQKASQKISLVVEKILLPLVDHPIPPRSQSVDNLDRPA